MIEAVVKSVLSADTLILAHPTKLPPVEKMVTLANINAPRYAKKAGDKEEPFAYLAREYVRQKCIGKLVRFEVSYSNPKTGRDFGHVYIGTTNDVENNLGYQLVERGLASLVKTRSDGTEVQERMLEAFEQAQQLGRGIHTNDQNILRENTRQPQFDHINLKDIKKRFSSNTQPVKCVVEHVLSGSTVVVQLNDTFENVLVHMSGIRCPRIRYKTVQEIGKDGKVTQVKRPDPEPLAQEARHFTEARLLNRDVVLYLDNVREDKHENSLIGSITAAINVPQNAKQLPRVHQEDLLEKGFARFVDYETYGSAFTKQMERAEQAAKSRRLRIWKDYQEPQSSLQKGDQKEVQARAVEILSGDKIRVRYLTPGREEELIALSCIRAPKMGTKNSQPEPWAVEAKEKLRATIAGHKLSIKVDYRRPVKVARTSNVDGEKQTETSEEERKFATVRVKGKNVALPLVKSGYVSVLFRKFDEERSDDYGELKDVERTAINSKKGVHGNPKSAPKQFINDLSFKNLGEVQKFAPLIIGKKVKAVVEKVHAAHRLKLFIPKHHCKITFTLSGISVPSLKSTDPEEARIAQEGLDYAMDKLLLRDVEVDINSVNNVGNFLGNIYVKNKDTFVYDLIRQGLAEVRTGKFVDKLPNVAQLRAAEVEGQEAEVGLYKNWREKRAQRQQEQDEQEEEAAQPQRHQHNEPQVKIHPDESGLHQIRVTEIIDVSHLYMQTSDAAQHLSKIDALLRQLDLNRSTAVFTSVPKVGTVCFAKFSYDNQWYRAKVKSVQGEQVSAVYIDYGNTEQVTISELRAIENNTITKELLQIPPQVKEVYLAFIQPPPDLYADDAYYYLQERIQDKDLYARLEYEDRSSAPHKQYVTLYRNPDGTGNIQEDLLKNGYARVHIPDYLRQKAYNMWLARKSQTLVRAEELAKTVHKGIWEQGEGVF